MAPPTSSIVEDDMPVRRAAAFGMQEIGNRFQRRRLARPVGAEQRDDLSAPDIQVYAMERPHGAPVDRVDVANIELNFCR